MKAIMISIKPEFVQKILNGNKTIEILKTKPSCEIPCKVYIYCTKGKSDKDSLVVSHSLPAIMPYRANERVVAEFTLNKVDILERDLNDWLPKNRYDVANDLFKNINLNQEQLWNCGQGKTLYAWHIDDLKVYDKPKELSEFSEFIPNNKCEKHENGFACEKCDAYDKEHDTCLVLYYCRKPIKRPPQSYCYVGELGNE